MSNVYKRWSASLLMLSVVTFALRAAAVQRIKIEIVSLTWTVGVDHNGSFHARAVLPDGVHILLLCQAEEKLCAFSPEKLRRTSGCDREHMVVTCIANHLGYFSARRDGDDMIIFGAHESSKYRIVGSW